MRPRDHHIRFCRDHLPSAAEYWARHLGHLAGGGPWRTALCPLHGDKRPSLRVNVQSGAWRCMSCGAAGGDVLSFHMRRYGLPFVEAASDLGAVEVFS